MAGTGEKGEQDHFFQQEPASRLDLMNSKAAALKWNITRV